MSYYEGRGNVREVADSIKEDVDFSLEVLRKDLGLQLKKESGRWKATCPFHIERTPSFGYDPRKRICKCFGCGAGGDIIKIVQMYRQIDFIEALEELAGRKNLTVDFGRGEDYKSHRSRRTHLFEVLDFACRHFQDNLIESEAMMSYLIKERGLKEETIREFRIGYALPEKDTLTFILRENPDMSVQDGEEVSVLSYSEDEPGRGRYYDFFRNRITFPIFDRSMRVVGFTARAMDERVKAKYINGRNTILYNKSEALYGLPQAMARIKDQQKVLVVEGSIDVNLLWQEGKAVVAPCGTAFGEDHADVLGNCFHDAEKLFLFDGDKAGRDGAFGVAKKTLGRLGKKPRFALLPKGEDPADLVREGRQSEIFSSMNGAVYPSDYLFDYLIEKDRLDINKVEDKYALLSELVDVARETDDFFRQMFMSDVVGRVGIGRNQLENRIISEVSSGSKLEIDMDGRMRSYGVNLELEFVRSFLDNPPSAWKYIISRTSQNRFLLPETKIWYKFMTEELAKKDGGQWLRSKLDDLGKELWKEEAIKYVKTRFLEIAAKEKIIFSRARFDDTLGIRGQIKKKVLKLDDSINLLAKVLLLNDYLLAVTNLFKGDISPERIIGGEV